MSGLRPPPFKRVVMTTGHWPALFKKKYLNPYLGGTNMQYVMLLQVKEKSESETVFKAIKLPECKDTDTTYLYKVLSYFALNNWVHLCGVIPCFECGSLTDEEIKFWKSHLVEYKEIIKD